MRGQCDFLEGGAEKEGRRIACIGGATQRSRMDIEEERGGAQAEQER